MKVAMATNDTEAVQRLILEGEPLDIMNVEMMQSPASWAAERGHTTLMRFLLDHGASTEEPSIEGESLLIVAARAGQSEIVRLLLDRGADPNYVTPNGWSALDYARICNHQDIFKLLAQVSSRRKLERNRRHWHLRQAA
jgi:ankyrin repeat protein